MVTTVTKTIGPTGDYSTLQAWEDAAPANLVTADQVWQGVVQVGATFSAGSNLITIAGSTSDATRYKELTVAATGAWCDSTSNALAYNTGSGAYIVNTAGYANVITITEDYARVSRVQLRATVNSSRAISNTGANVRINSVIASTAGYNVAYWAGSNGVITNSLLTQTGVRSSDLGACIWFDVGSSGTKLLNCTVAYPGAGNTNTGVLNNNYSSTTVKNVVAVGYADGFNRRTSGTTYSNCFQDTTGTSYTGVTNSLAFSTANFVNVGNSTPDLKLVTGSALLNVGTTDTDAATDPYGTARPSGAAYDVGAHELSAPSSSISGTATLGDITASGSLSVATSDVSGGATLADITASGTVSSSPASGTITSPILKNNAGTILASVTGIVANVYNPTTGALVVRKTGLSSSGAGIVTITDVLITAGVTYAYELDLSATSQGRRLPTGVAA